MSDYTLFAIILVVSPSLALATGFLLHELRLQRMARRGFRQTYGITGSRVHCEMQIADLRVRHDMARGVDQKNVVPFPRTAKRGESA